MAFENQTENTICLPGIFILPHFCLISSHSKHLAPCLMQIQDTTVANKYTKKLQTIHYWVILFD